MRRLENVRRLDVAWDLFLKVLKGQRGTNEDEVVADMLLEQARFLPANWADFPCVDDNKTDLISVTPPLFPWIYLMLYKYLLLYSRICDINNVKEARKQPFFQGSRTETALLQHCKGAVYQGGYVWGQPIILSPALPNPVDLMGRKTTKFCSFLDNPFRSISYHSHICHTGRPI